MLVDCVPEDLGDTVDIMLNDSCQSLQSPPSVGSVQIGNGIVCYNGLLTGSEAIYSCNCGFRLQGVETRTCQRNGLWGRTTPVCQTDCKFVDLYVISFSVLGLCKWFLPASYPATHESGNENMTTIFLCT